MWLTIRSGAGEGDTVEVTGSHFVVGRDEACDLRIDDERASRRHAAFEALPDGRAALRDLGSSNGTYVDGQLITAPIVLEGNETIQIGNTILIVTRGAGAGGRTVIGVVPGGLARPAAAAEPAVSPTAEAPTPSSVERVRLRRSVRRLGVLAGLLSTLAVGGIAVGVLFVVGVIGGEEKPEQPLSVPELIAAVESSTVQIRGKDVPSDDSVGTGTGWVLDAEQGLIVTNAHVVNAFPLMVVAVGDDERSAEIVGVAPCEDLAVLRLRDTEGLVTLPLGSQSRLALGETVVALGFPVNAALGDDLTATTGVVSVVQTEWSIPNLDVPLLTNVIQTDAVINPGNSGGPLVDTHGTVVGINTLGVQMAASLGFAIPIDVVKRVVERLRTDGRVLRSWSGLTLRPLVDYAQGTVFDGEKGVIVDDVAPASPAERAGVQKGDRLLEVAGRETNGRYREDLPEILWTLADLPDGRPAALVVERAGTRLRVSVVPELCDGCDVLGFEAPRWGSTFQAITRDRVPDLAFQRKSGVYVLGVKYPGPAAEAGLREGDILLSVDRVAVGDLAALAAAYERVCLSDGGRPSVLLEILRDGRRTFLAVDVLPSAAEGR